MDPYRRARAMLHPLRAAYVATIGQAWFDARNAYRNWRQSYTPRSLPIKRTAVAEAGHIYGLRTLIETGTFLGDMVAANLVHFDRLVSIELAPALAAKAQRRFRFTRKVTILQGDSAALLPQILSGLDGPALFWLDGHFSGGFTAKTDTETPVREELRLVLSHPFDHVILIDDARAFDGTNDYPTLPELCSQITAQGRGHSVTVEDDIIRIVPEAIIK